MKTRGARFLLILGAGLAVMAFVVVYIVMSKGITQNQPAANVPQTVDMKTIAVVNQDLPAFTVLDPSNVATTDVEASTFVTGTVVDPTAVYGKMTRIPLTRSQPLRADMLTEAGFSSILNKGERGFSLAVPERSTFGGTISENDRVDVLWSVTLEYYAQKPLADGKFDFEKQTYTSTKTLLQNIRVLRVLHLAAPTPAKQNTGEGATQTAATTRADNASLDLYSDQAGYSTALVLGVTDQQAEVLKFARESGVLDLTLRSSATLKDDAGNLVKDEKGNPVQGDHDPEKTTGISIDQLIKDYGIPVPTTNK